MRPLNSGTICSPTVPNTRYLAHELGHYLGLQHVMAEDNDLLGDTMAHPVTAPDCAAPFSPGPLGDAVIDFHGVNVTINTDNIMSYYHHISPRITTSQAAIVRGTSYARFY